MRILYAAISAALCLAGCAAPVRPIVINRADLVQSGSLTLTAVEAGVSAYQTKKPIPPSILDKLRLADAEARAAIASLSNSAAIELPDAAKAAATALQAVVAALPPGVLPPAAEAGLVAFSALAQVVAQTAPQAVAQPSTVSAPEAPAVAPIPPPAVVAAAPAPIPPPTFTPTQKPQPHFPVHPGAPVPSVIH